MLHAFLIHSSLFDPVTQHLVLLLRCLNKAPIQSHSSVEGTIQGNAGADMSYSVYHQLLMTTAVKMKRLYFSSLFFSHIM